MEPVDDLINVGRINRPHGIKGEIELSVLTDYPQRFKPEASFLLSPPVDDLDVVNVENVKSKKNVLILKLKEINGRDGAERLRGHNLAIRDEDLMNLSSDSFWHFELIGLRVTTVDGRELGVIKEILSGQGHDIFVVRNSKEYLIPAVKKVIKDVQIEEGQMVISPTPGLL